jgi:hypothetical protein
MRTQNDFFSANRQLHEGCTCIRVPADVRTISRARRPLCALICAAVLAGCANVAGTKAGDARVREEVSAFSTAQPGGALPDGWELMSLSRFKRDTSYKLIRDPSGVTVIEARAERSASGLTKKLNIDAAKLPWLSWRWRVPQLISAADNTRRDKEDSPVRLVITFDGDVNKLDFEERALSSRAKALTGRELPYATLMYIWENRADVGQIIESHHTTRLKMVVAESGPQRRGAWLNLQRNVLADFERAFGEKPGRIRSIGIMTDTDNTGEDTTAFYGDIRFSAKPEGGGVVTSPTDKAR